MPWFPEFFSAVELARRQTRAVGLADPVGQYFAALNTGDVRVLETVWSGEVVVFDPRSIRAATTTEESTTIVIRDRRHGER